MKFKLLIVILLCFVALAGFVSQFVWIPDLITRREVIVGACDLPNGETVELVQVWNGDGYWTFVRHHPESGPPSFVVGNPGMRKIWSASMEVRQELGHVSIWLNDRRWNYYYNSHSLVSKKLNR